MIFKIKGLYKVAFLLIFYGVFVTACKDDRPVITPNNNILVGQRGVFITNEGNFQFGNASITLYEPDSRNAVNNYFENVNNRPLGDVCQSIHVFNGKAYMVLNNSGNIEVVNAYTFESEATISGFIAPRYFLPVSLSKAYISDLYAGQISVLNLTSQSVSKTINYAGWSEQMLNIYGKAFVTNQENTYIYVINTAKDEVVDSIYAGLGSNSIVEDANAQLWVLCSDLNGQKKARLLRINPVTHAVEKEFVFQDENDLPWRLKINARGDILYFLNEHVYRMPIDADELPTQSFITSQNNNFYGLGVCPFSGDVYVSDAIDYVQRGVVYRYSANGVEVDVFQSGIIPGDFWFW